MHFPAGERNVFSPIIAELDPTIAGVISAVIAAAFTFIAVKFLDRLRKKDAETEARTILERAEREATNRRREAELEIKERALQQKAKTEEELGKIRDELRERERLLDKRRRRSNSRPTICASRNGSSRAHSGD